MWIEFNGPIDLSTEKVRDALLSCGPLGRVVLKGIQVRSHSQLTIIDGDEITSWGSQPLQKTKLGKTSDLKTHLTCSSMYKGQKYVLTRPLAKNRRQ